MIYGIPALNDNYIWVIVTEGAVVVDPGEAAPVLAFLKDRGLTLQGILTTHKHGDHTGGVAELVRAYPDVSVYGPREVGQLATAVVAEGDTVTLDGRVFHVLSTPGHTETHISYLTDGKLFCGDAMFSAGCGRVFTGDFHAQFQTMAAFKALPPGTEVYAAHEYTLTNLTFARDVLPENRDIESAYNEVKAMRAQGRRTLPSTIERERAINPFFIAEDEATFIAYRKKRDTY
ncbi:hydroxyacylglutathione hydrolase [Peptoniphilus equinus]|uniref:Hydroxyacylglutathione hydrolase n=1 Tax=Peptoniphilus equinus TaxID=3016343 RepID=A0ABY7QUG4_9FIRM|nr:hydroxyacylglutathione hydrolase [Peptoniphilus equinus]WBW50081.1 hydroxyacylglutathione hydrolase [Peptoniphilus equinus]